MKKYQTILADPPWEQTMAGKYRTRHRRITELAYPTMTVDDICKLPVGDIAGVGCHLWLWTTNQFLPAGFKVMEAWGFKYLAPITWVKPSGCGNWFVSVTQTLLFGYKEKCIFPLARYKSTVVSTSIPKRHSQKPDVFYDLIESISPEPRIELFSRAKRLGWDCWGNEVESDIEL
uniref:Putative methyltransferase n=1 Tax=viral metagenome TaxID=1070528 RepID=A0A6M3L5X5_9ZZZZ